jgi:hypothetical protein
MPLSLRWKASWSISPVNLVWKRWKTAFTIRRTPGHRPCIVYPHTKQEGKKLNYSVIFFTNFSTKGTNTKPAGKIVKGLTHFFKDPFTGDKVSGEKLFGEERNVKGEHKSRAI